MVRKALWLGLALVISTASAQLGQTREGLLKQPVFAQARAGAAGTLTLADGSRVVLKEKSGLLLGATILVPYTPVPTDRPLSPDALKTAQARAATAFRRTGELAGAVTGYGGNLSTALEQFLQRADITPKLPDGVTGNAAPYTLKMRSRGGVLTTEVEIAKLAVTQIAPSANAIAPKKTTAAPVVVRVFSDFQCPFCQKFELETFPQLLATLPDDVRVEFQHLPLESIHPAARPAAEASECAAGQGKFWPYKDALFAQTTWAQANPNAAFIALAEGLKLDMTAFRSCLAERGGKAVVDAQLKAAVAQGLNSTPSVYVNGYRVSNPFDLAELQKLIQFARTVDGPASR